MSICLNCGKEIIGKKKYCNNQCQADYQYKEWIIRWKNEQENGLNGEYGISNYLKRYLFEKFNNQCCQCGWSKINPYSNTIPLEIDHIDGDFRNNSENNLRLLCPNCDSLLDTYKSKNKNSARTHRKEYL